MLRPLYFKVYTLIKVYWVLWVCVPDQSHRPTCLGLELDKEANVSQPGKDTVNGSRLFEANPYIAYSLPSAAAL